MTHRVFTPSMLRGRALASLLAAATVAAISPRAAAAQSDAPDCVAIVAEMLTPTPSPGSIRASAGCPATGPVTLASRWTRRGARGTAERAALVEASTWLRDARLYDAVSTVVRDGSYPSAERIAGMRVLVSYAEAGFSVSQQGQARSTKPTAATTTPPANNQLRPTIREDIKRDLVRLAREDQDGDVRWAAQKASESLGYVAPKGAKVARYRSP